ncbi:MAG: peptidylprolyl isomerase [Phycisphaerales bacterium]|nr:peptidylprolyl isomerase [Phycisphaerales bacterium]
MPIRRVVLAAVSLVLLLSACGGTSASTITSPEYQNFRDQTTACGADQPAPGREMSFTTPDALGITDTITAVMHTSCGDVTLNLYPQIAPMAVNSFVFLAEHGYFDGTVAIRIIPGFIVQFGDPTATGRGGPGYTLPDELPADGFPYNAGVVAMANSGPDTSGSQFFIVLGNTGLPNDYTVFAAVMEGADQLNSIQRIPVGQQASGLENSRPLETVYIESIDIQR